MHLAAEVAEVAAATADIVAADIVAAGMTADTADTAVVVAQSSHTAVDIAIDAVESVAFHLFLTLFYRLFYRLF